MQHRELAELLAGVESGDQRLILGRGPGLAHIGGQSALALAPLTPFVERPRRETQRPHDVRLLAGTARGEQLPCRGVHAARQGIDQLQCGDFVHVASHAIRRGLTRHQAAPWDHADSRRVRRQMSLFVRVLLK